MRLQQIEGWALEVIEALRRGNPVEWARVELKSKWPDPASAARRIAGHANAARGESILWLIGMDEKSGTVLGCDQQELADWWPGVQKFFDGPTPSLREVLVYPPEGCVMALHFETDRSPYVVKGHPNEKDRYDVPWRDGTRTRHATRSELLRLLLPHQKRPDVEVLDGWLKYEDRESSTIKGYLSRHWELVLELYVMPRDNEPVVVPFHHCEVSISGPYQMPDTRLAHVVIGGRASAQGVTFATAENGIDITFSSSARCFLTATGETDRRGGVVGRPAVATAVLKPLRSEIPVMLKVEIPYENDDRWALGNKSRQSAGVRTYTRPSDSATAEW